MRQVLLVFGGLVALTAPRHVAAQQPVIDLAAIAQAVELVTNTATQIQQLESLISSGSATLAALGLSGQVMLGPISLSAGIGGPGAGLSIGGLNLGSAGGLITSIPSLITPSGGSGQALSVKASITAPALASADAAAMYAAATFYSATSLSNPAAAASIQQQRATELRLAAVSGEGVALHVAAAASQSPQQLQALAAAASDPLTVPSLRSAIDAQTAVLLAMLEKLDYLAATQAAALRLHAAQSIASDPSPTTTGAPQ